MLVSIQGYRVISATKLDRTATVLELLLSGHPSASTSCHCAPNPPCHLALCLSLSGGTKIFKNYPDSKCTTCLAARHPRASPPDPSPQMYDGSGHKLHATSPSERPYEYAKAACVRATLEYAWNAHVHPSAPWLPTTSPSHLLPRAAVRFC